jgi:hypothetical protein
MARINYDRLASESTTSSLYRGRTPESQSSDKENGTPSTQQKRKMPPTQPNSSRGGLAVRGSASKRRKTQSTEAEDDQEEEQQQQRRRSTESIPAFTQYLSQRPFRKHETETQKYYDPDQNPEERREARIAMRDNRNNLLGMLISCNRIIVLTFFSSARYDTHSKISVTPQENFKEPKQRFQRRSPEYIRCSS